MAVITGAAGGIGGALVAAFRRAGYRTIGVDCAAEDGIRVNAIAPGWIETPMTVPARSDAARNRAILDRTPLGRWGTPEDLAGPALFLASDAARFITGAVLVVDGGYSAK